MLVYIPNIYPYIYCLSHHPSDSHLSLTCSLIHPKTIKHQSLHPPHPFTHLFIHPPIHPLWAPLCNLAEDRVRDGEKEQLWSESKHSASRGTSFHFIRVTSDRLTSFHLSIPPTAPLFFPSSIFFFILLSAHTHPSPPFYFSSHPSLHPTLSIARAHTHTHTHTHTVVTIDRVCVMVVGSLLLFLLSVWLEQTPL